MDELEEIRQKKLAELKERTEAAPVSQPLSEPFEVTDATFEKAVQEHEILFIDFWAPWCGPCRMVAPVVRELARDYAGRVAFGKVNTDENPRTAMQFRIMSIPTLMLFRDGRPVDTMIGAAPRGIIEGMIQKHLT